MGSVAKHDWNAFRWAAQRKSRRGRENYWLWRRSTRWPPANRPPAPDTRPFSRVGGVLAIFAMRQKCLG